VALTLHNTLSGRVEPLETKEPGKVGLYVCGVTVYDRCHVGHARSFIFADTLVRYLRFTGYEVNFVRNITDIDDKIIERAQKRGITPEELTAETIGYFHANIAALGCVMPDEEPRATTHIPDMLALIQQLEERGLAYASEGDVYFAVGKLDGYGKLSKRKLDEMIAGSRVEVGDRKREPLDFALWKAAKPGEPSWDSPWGPGRPGWHLECSAMSTRYLGQPFDLHAGGEDLIFPHHENEIAQSEGATGIPFVKHWVHHAFVRIDQEKMSKSVGNILSIDEISAMVPVEAVRLFLISTHYRSPLDFSEQGVREAQRGCERLHETLARLETALGAPLSPAGNGSGRAAEKDADVPAEVRAFREQFVTAMDDDLNSARATGVIFEEIREINRLLDAGETDTLAAHGANVAMLGGVLGVIRTPAQAYLDEGKSRHLDSSGVDGAEIETLIAERNAARKAKDFARADEIRDELQARGIVLKDGAGGTTWSVQ